MTRLCDVAQLIRSKNAGPFELTIDVIFSDPEVWKKVVASNVLNSKDVASIYHLSPDVVRVYPYEAGRAIKVSFPRPIPSGAREDYDVTGGQHYAPLVDLELPTAWDA